MMDLLPPNPGPCFDTTPSSWKTPRLWASWSPPMFPEQSPKQIFAPASHQSKVPGNICLKTPLSYTGNQRTCFCKFKMASFYLWGNFIVFRARRKKNHLKFHNFWLYKNPNNLMAIRSIVIHTLVYFLLTYAGTSIYKIQVPGLC